MRQVPKPFPYATRGLKASRSEPLRPALLALSLAQDLMDKSDGDRALPDCRRDALEAAAANVANCEYSGETGLEQEGRPGERPLGRGQIVRRQIRASLDEAFGVQRQAVMEPISTRNGTGH